MKILQPAFFLLLIASGFLFPSCDNRRPPEPELSKAEYTAFCKELEKQLNSGNAEAFANAIDLETMTDHVIDGKDGGSFSRPEISKAITAAMSQFTVEVGNAIRSSGKYRFLHLVYRDKTVRALFRLHSSKGINYHELLFVVHDHKPQISDVYVYLTGENLSETLRNLLAASGNLGTTDREFQREAENLDEMRKAIQLGDVEKAYRLYNSLSAKMRQTKAVQMYNILISEKMSEAMYSDAIDQYEKMFPNDPSLRLVSLDGYALNKEYKKLFTCINKLDATVNDPYLDFFRANALFEMDSIDAALKTLKKVCVNAPDDNPDIYISVALIDVRFKKDPQDACKYLGLMKEHFQTPIGAIRQKFFELLAPQDYHA